MTAIAPDTCLNFLFDFDGTLVDTTPLHAEAYRAVLAERRPDLLPGFDYQAVKGKTTRAGYASLGVAEAELDEFTADKQALFRAAVAAGRMPIMPGAVDLLRTLAGIGKVLFLVTSGSFGSVSAALRASALTDLFTGIITAEDVARGKPAPDPFLLCLERYELSTAESVVVEDALSGVQSGHAAGLRVIAVHDTSLKGEADLFFPDLIALRTWATQ
ncbi:MAG TPA: HAD family phosphatase [Alphaproteobacteria bacterium]|nr:HAD family phosphatase [Alphaproteobacteria bacterium]